mgnify:CR=1 FL=1
MSDRELELLGRQTVDGRDPARAREREVRRPQLAELAERGVLEGQRGGYRHAGRYPV